MKNFLAAALLIFIGASVCWAMLTLAFMDSDSTHWHWAGRLIGIWAAFIWAVIISVSVFKD